MSRRWIKLSNLALGLLSLSAILQGTLHAQSTGSSSSTPSKSTSAKIDPMDVEANKEQIVTNLKTWFKRCDINSSKALEKSEMYRSFGQRDYAKAVNKLDEDKDGKVSEEEFQKWAESHAATTAQTIADEAEKAKQNRERYLAFLRNLQQRLNSTGC
jgi:hypothetical protein